VRYEIHIHAVLDESWSQWFEGIELEPTAGDRTRLIGDIEDQSALHGVLARIRDLGLELVSVARIDNNYNPAKDPDPKETS